MSTRGTVPHGRADDLPLDLDPGWGIPAMFGGALAAALVRLDDDSSTGWLPTEVQAVFHRPVPPGPARAVREVLHEGRTKRGTEIRAFVADRHAVTVLAGWTRAHDLEVVASPVPRDLPAPAVPALGDLGEHVDWRAERQWPLRRPGRLEAWIRPRDDGWDLRESAATEATALHPAWYLVAGDLLAPAVVRRGESLRIATVALQLTVSRLASPGWIRQSLRATRIENRATAVLELRSGDGDLLATVQQSALLMPADREEMPVSATGFGWGGTPPADYINTARPHAID